MALQREQMPLEGTKMPSCQGSSIQTGPDELIIDRDKLPTLDQVKNRIEERFHVTVDYDMAMQVESGGQDWKQWVTISGEYEDRKMAKDYIKALCNPQECVPLKYPEELHAVLTNPRIHSRLEIQSRTVILFQVMGEAVIQGSDALSVTLAMSAVEDLIAKYENDETSPVKSSPLSRMASARLDQALKRLGSQDEGIIYDEDLSSMPTAVKRSILGWLMEDSQTESETASPHKSTINDIKQVASQLEQGIHISPKPKTHNFPVDKSNGALQGSSQDATEHDLRDFALERGYSNEEIQEVLKTHGSDLKASEFLRALFTNQRAKNVKKPQSDAPSKVNLTGETGATPLLSGMTTPPKSRTSGDSDNMLHPFEHILEAQGSPHLKHKRESSPSKTIDKNNQRTYAEYMEKLARHFTEEDQNESIDDLKKKNLERQQILRDHFDRQKQEEAQLHTKSEHKEEDSPLPKKRKGRRNRKKGQQNRSSPQISDSGEGTENENADEIVGVSVLRATASAPGATGLLDTDNLSLPYMGRDREEGLPSGVNTNTNNHLHSQKPYDRRYNDRSRSPNSRIRPSAEGVPPRGHQASSPQRAAKQIPPLLPGPSGHGPVNLMAVAIPSTQRPETLHGQTHQVPGSELPYQLPGPSQVSGPTQHYAHPSSAQQNSLRYIVIDGSNLAMTHGNGEFSCRGIQLCIDFFRRRGHTEITAFVPQWRTREPRYDQPIHDQHLLEELKKKGFLVFTPARRVPGKNIVCYDDRFVLRLAAETDGVIVSNDNYRDLWHENREWRTLIEERLLMFSFVGDIFMPPDDPLGRDGPTLGEFLAKPDPMIGLLRPSRPHFGQHQPNQGRGMQGRGQGQNYWTRPQNPGQGQGQGNWPRGQNTGRGQGQRGRQDFQQPRFSGPGRGGAHNAHGRGGNAGQRGHGGPAQVSTPAREATVSEWLFQQLVQVFPDSEEQVSRILQNHPAETDLNKLSAFVLEVLN